MPFVQKSILKNMSLKWGYPIVNYLESMHFPIVIMGNVIAQFVTMQGRNDLDPQHSICKPKMIIC